VNNKVRVLLCDDQTAIRSHLRKTLASTPDVQVVGEASGGRAGVRMALELMPDLVLMDVSMPDLNGIEATRQILAAAPAIKVVIFSSECDIQVVEMAVSSGASGYLVKSGNADELVHAIRTVMQGGRYVSTAIKDVKQDSGLPGDRNPAQTRVPSGDHQGPVRVVLVDDAVFLRERLAELLSALEGVEVVGQAVDVPSGSTLVRELRPDVLVLDIDLPGQSGLELLEKIGRQEDGPLIIVLTNYDYPVLRHGCAKLGADFYFYKPIEFERVTEVCQDLAKRRTRKSPTDQQAEPSSPNSPDSP
jgi:DNA-binding NarL/FixJ family response regulator